MVPVLQDVAGRSATELRAGLDRMRADAAARSTPPEELCGATISLSNFGMIGGRFANLVPKRQTVTARRESRGPSAFKRYSVFVHFLSQSAMRATTGAGSIS